MTMLLDPNFINVRVGRFLYLTSKPAIIRSNLVHAHACQFLESLHDNLELPTNQPNALHIAPSYLHGRINLSMFYSNNANQDLLLFAHTWSFAAQL